MKVKEYKIVTAAYFENLEVFVNRRLCDGWIPVGSPVQVNSSTGGWCQAMILPEKEESKNNPVSLLAALEQLEHPYQSILSRIQ